MKKQIFSLSILLTSTFIFGQEVKKDSIKSEKLDEVIITATRATQKTPVTFTNITKKELKQQNLGQDLPILLDQLPSVVTTSDAGAGIGYTGIRVRGTDATRINVTINGIPYNDAESQGTFWVNMPDFSSSVEDIQLQRGVGTSKNGSGAFGASLNITTSKPSKKGFISTSHSYGSFNSKKHNLVISSGLLNNFYASARLSKITSDGYVDRSASNLESYFAEGGYVTDKTQIQAIIFGGQEITQQAWYGTPEAVINKDLEGIKTFLSHEGYSFSDNQIKNLLSNNGRTYNHYTYDNEVDNYTQTHYQGHFTHKLNEFYTLKLSGNYTRGKGYFEQFKPKEKVKKYFPNSPNKNEKGEVIKRRWLDNHFYATVYSLNYKKNKLNITLGGGYNYYNGDHYGKVIWDSFPTEQIDYKKQYYFSTGIKDEFNTYLKAEYDITKQLFAYADLQYRGVSHKGKGTDNDLNPINFNRKFKFFNPKVGLNYAFNSNHNIYSSFAIANREPNRDDLTKIGVITKPENLQDLEFGYKFKNNTTYATVNLYYMNYKDQLILTGKVDDVGSSIKENVENSYRAGIEIQAGHQISKNIRIDANATFSKNKIENFNYSISDTQYNPQTYEETYNTVVTNYKDTDISFSPNIIANGKLTFNANENISFAWIAKYVGKQFLDNTSSDNKKINAYFVNNLNASFKIKQNFIDEISLTLLVNNILNKKYVSNGYTYSYYYRPIGSNDSVITEKFYYPQATRNFLLGATLKF